MKLEEYVRGSLSSYIYSRGTFKTELSSLYEDKHTKQREDNMDRIIDRMEQDHPSRVRKISGNATAEQLQKLFQLLPNTSVRWLGIGFRIPRPDILKDAFTAGKYFVNIERFNISQAGVTDEEVIALAQAIKLGQLPKLKRLELQVNEFGTRGGRAIFDILASTNGQAIEYLDLTRRHPPIGRVVDGQSVYPFLKELRMSFDLASYLEFNYLLDAVSRGCFPKLECLFLDLYLHALLWYMNAQQSKVQGSMTYNYIPAEDHDSIARFLQRLLTDGEVQQVFGDVFRNSPVLKELDLTVRSMNSQRFERTTVISLSPGAPCPSSLSAAVEVLTPSPGIHLHNLNLSGNGLKNPVALQLAKILQSNALPLLKSLRLEKNAINHLSATAIFQALFQGGSNLTALNLSNNNLGPNFLRDVPLAESRCNLRKLWLNETNLQERGVMTVVNLVQQGCCPKLTHLELSHTKDCGTALTDFMLLLPSSTLTWLSLVTCRFSPGSLAKLGDDVTSTPLLISNLRRLEIRNCNLGVEDLQCLLHYLMRVAPKLEYLNLVGNDDSQPIASVLASAVRSWRHLSTADLPITAPVFDSPLMVNALTNHPSIRSIAAKWYNFNRGPAFDAVQKSIRKQYARIDSFLAFCSGALCETKQHGNIESSSSSSRATWASHEQDQQRCFVHLLCSDLLRMLCEFL